MDDQLKRNEPIGTVESTRDADALFQRRITEDQLGFELAFRRDYPLAWISSLIIPPVLTITILVFLYLWQGGEYTGKVVSIALSTFFFLGKFVILGGTERSGEIAAAHQFLTSEELFVMVLYMDLMTAVLLVFHSSFLFRLPVAGPKLLELVEDGQFILKRNSWMKRATFVGLIAFVMFPLSATGAVGGSIFGRLLGLSRGATFGGIAIGSILGCGMMYFGAAIINRYLDRDNPMLTIGGLAVVAAIILLLNNRYRALKELDRNESA